MWKPIIDFENYEVNELGEVRRDGKMKKAYDDGYGYLHIRLWKDCKGKNFLIHRLIALHFIDNPNNHPCIDHINGVTTDNRIENLRWCTLQQNQWNRKSKGYSIRNGKYQAQIRLNGKLIYIGCFDTEEEARQAYLTKKEELHGLEFIRK